ncbi:unnamed protein product, partial [Sphagnum troendelagicum]
MADFKILQLIFGWLEYFSYLLLEVEIILYVYFSSCEMESCSTRVKQLLFCIITYGGGAVDELGLGNSEVTARNERTKQREEEEEEHDDDDDDDV